MTLGPAAQDSGSRPPTPWRADLARVPVEVVEHTQGTVAGVPVEALMWRSAAFFMSELRDERGEPLIVEEHHEEWCNLMQSCPLLALLAPRDHGKTWTALAYLAWRIWRHNRDENGHLLEGDPQGRFQAVIFSDTKRQAEEFFERFQAFVVANEHLFGDMLPSRRGTRNRTAWSRTRIRMRNAAEVSIRAFKTSTRGLHPDLLLLDDVLNDRTTLTQYQRDAGWRYFYGTLMPMNASQIIIIGTAFHYDDLLHRLRPDPSKAPLIVRDRATSRTRKVRFRWVKYRAVNWETGEVLWEAQHSLEDLAGRRDADPLLFSREFQNDPRDDASSMFPYTLTARTLDENGHFLPLVPGAYRPPGGWVTVLGMDLASSEEVGADFTSIMVLALERSTMRRRLLWAYRERGVGFDTQIGMLRAACAAFDVVYGIVEQNNFQRWLVREVQKYPETAGRIFGHTTGQEKRSLVDGVPALKLGLTAGLWTIPAGDTESRTWATVWQAEMAAFGWKDGKLQGVGEHDDTVMTTWFADLACRQIEEWLRSGPAEEVITGEEMGVEPVLISQEY